MFTEYIHTKFYIQSFNEQSFADKLFRNNQQDATMYYNLLFRRFLLLNKFQATHRSSSGTQKLYLQPLVLHTSVVAGRCHILLVTGLGIYYLVPKPVPTQM